MQRLAIVWRASLVNKIVIVGVPLVVLCSACCVCVGLAAALTGGGQAAIATTDTPIPTRTPRTLSTATAVASATQPATRALAPTAAATTASAQALPAGRVITDDEVSNLVLADAQANGVSVDDASIIDTRPTGGNRTMRVIIHVDGYGTNQFYTDIGKVVLGFDRVNQHAQVAVDELDFDVCKASPCGGAIDIILKKGTVLAIVEIMAADSHAWATGAISVDQFVARWHSVRY